MTQQPWKNPEIHSHRKQGKHGKKRCNQEIFGALAKKSSETKWGR